MLEDRGGLPKEEGDSIREYKAVHEENFLSSWLRDDTEGCKSEEVKKSDRKEKEEAAQSGKREVEGGGERVEIDGKRVCVGFCSNLTSQEEGGKDASLSEVVGGVSDGELAVCASVYVSGSVSGSVCFLPLVFDPTGSPDSESECFSVSCKISSQNVVCVSQTFSFSEKCGATGTLLSERFRRARMGTEAAPVKSTPKRTPVKAVPECLRNKAPPPPQGGATATNSDVAWPAVGSATGTRLKNNAKPQHWHIGAGVQPPWQWNGRERVLTEPMEDYLKGSEHLNVAIAELEHFLFSPEDNAISILSCAGRWTKEVRSAGD